MSKTKAAPQDPGTEKAAARLKARIASAQSEANQLVALIEGSEASELKARGNSSSSFRDSF